MHEIDYVCMKDRKKTQSCFVLKDIDCDLGSLMMGTVIRDQLFTEEFNSREADHLDVLIRLIATWCVNFLMANADLV
jgi:hypothetical protein